VIGIAKLREYWIPAFAGMTTVPGAPRSAFLPLALSRGGENADPRPRAMKVLR
jgi:hypothetical protein